MSRWTQDGCWKKWIFSWFPWIRNVTLLSGCFISIWINKLFTCLLKWRKHYVRDLSFYVLHLCLFSKLFLAGELGVVLFSVQSNLSSFSSMLLSFLIFSVSYWLWLWGKCWVDLLHPESRFHHFPPWNHIPSQASGLWEAKPPVRVCCDGHWQGRSSSHWHNHCAGSNG